MKQAVLTGKLLPPHPDILPILNDIREKYQIPPISLTDDAFRIFLENGLEIDWKAVHAEILKSAFKMEGAFSL
jgi:hypothetical protein